MPIETSYVCDESGTPCNDSDIANDQTGATQRVMLDATIYRRTPDGTVAAQTTGRHVFASIDAMVAWAEALTAS